MSRIGNIFLVWRKGPGERRIPVGIIKRNASEGTRFQYLDKGVKDANDRGFIPYPGFPEIDKIYDQNVLEIFSQRLSKSERKDLDEFYDFWKINKERRNDAYYMLAKTQGILPIDNFEFLADFNPKQGLTFVTEVVSLSRNKVSSDTITIGDILTYVLEPENEYDKDAVKIFKGDIFIGYIKLIHSKVFHRAKGEIKVRVQHIEKNGTISRLFVEISL